MNTNYRAFNIPEKYMKEIERRCSALANAKFTQSYHGKKWKVVIYYHVVDYDLLLPTVINSAATGPFREWHWWITLNMIYCLNDIFQLCWPNLVLPMCEMNV